MRSEGWTMPNIFIKESDSTTEQHPSTPRLVKIMSVLKLSIKLLLCCSLKKKRNYFFSFPLRNLFYK